MPAAFPGGQAFGANRPKLIQIKAPDNFSAHADRMWNPIASAPFGRNLELAVLDEDGLHALVFPCEKSREGWLHAVSGLRIDIRPTHWRDWELQKDQAGLLQDLS
ncbi:hypothetical protein [Mesorhizobium sp. M1D.F.Ca.ET.234.01.1.1]|uniref:hypothetical protein n=1 Tax=unclassified Mesorhizobium TaxID=325217 RepID=UPI0032AE990C